SGSLPPCRRLTFLAPSRTPEPGGGMGVIPPLPEIHAELGIVGTKLPPHFLKHLHSLAFVRRHQPRPGGLDDLHHLGLPPEVGEATRPTQKPPRPARRVAWQRAAARQSAISRSPSRPHPPPGQPPAAARA